MLRFSWYILVICLMRQMDANLVICDPEIPLETHFYENRKFSKKGVHIVNSTSPQLSPDKSGGLSLD